MMNPHGSAPISRVSHNQNHSSQHADIFIWLGRVPAEAESLLGGSLNGDSLAAMKRSEG
jgi:hypothetical protein